MKSQLVGRMILAICTYGEVIAKVPGNTMQPPAV